MRGTASSILLVTMVAVATACSGDSGGKEALPDVDAGLEAPEKPLTIGKFRVVDACRTLPLRRAEKVFGPMAPEGYFTSHHVVGQEKKQVAPAPDDAVSSSCTYQFEDKRSQWVEVELTQFRTQQAAANKWSFTESINNGKLDASIARMAKRVQSSEGGDEVNQQFNKGSKKMLEAIRSSVDYLKRNAKGMRRLEKAGRAVLFNPSRSQFIALHRNVVATFTYSLGNPLNSEARISPEELAPQLGKIRATLTSIYHAIDSPELSQAPVSAILPQESKVGDTRLLEPCAVLTPEIFTKVIGVEAPLDMYFDSGPRVAAGYLRLRDHAAPSCERFTRHSSSGSPDLEGSMRLKLRHTESAGQARTSARISCDTNTHDYQQMKVAGTERAFRCTDPDDASGDSGGFAVGHYAVVLEAYRGRVFHGISLSDEEWTTAMQLLAKRVRYFTR